MCQRRLEHDNIYTRARNFAHTQDIVALLTPLILSHAERPSIQQLEALDGEVFLRFRARHSA